MMKSHFVFLSLLLCSTCFQEHANDKQRTEFCVTSNDSESNLTCHTLKYYMRNSSLFFKNNTAFIFYSGDHYTDLNVSLQVSNVSGLTLEGHDATIQCNQRNNSFHFAHVQGLSISGLNFSQCGLSSTDETFGYATLLVTDVIDFVLANVVISRSEYQGLSLHDAFGTILVANSIIECCQTNKYYEYDTHPSNVVYCTRNLPTKQGNILVKNTQFLNSINSVSSKELTSLQFDDPFAAGLTIVLYCHNITVRLDNVIVDGNAGRGGGNLAFIFYAPQPNSVPQVVLENSVIRNGVAVEGGGVYVFVTHPFLSSKQREKNNHTILFIRNSTFENNCASYTGGAISIVQKESNTSSFITEIRIDNCTFISNFLGQCIQGGTKNPSESAHGGTAITSTNYILDLIDQHVTPQFKTFVTDSSFHKNFVKNFREKDKLASTAVIFVKSNPYFSLRDVKIISNNSSGILGLWSNLVLGGAITISSNKAVSGGGILLCQNAILFLENGLDLWISNNYAQYAGGGIAVESVCVVSKPICFFQLASSSSQDFSNISIHLHNNLAVNSGNNLYGGSVDFCYTIDNSAHNTTIQSYTLFKGIFDIYPTYGNGQPSVTSDPNHVCICNNDEVDCSVKEYDQPSVYPGQQFNISVILAGQLNGSVPGLVRADLRPHTAFHDKRLQFQNLDTRNCNLVSYTIYSRTNVIMELSAAQQGDFSEIQYTPQYGRLIVNIMISDCPKGFIFSDEKGCDCDLLLANVKSVSCIITNQTIVVPSKVWIGYVNTTTNRDVCIVADHCPPEYCRPGKSFISTSLTDFSQDSQCQQYRTGVMCGQCKEGYSATFKGGCVKCSNNRLWLILLYAFAGIFLVFILTFLDISVADGTINGLIFYANVVQANYPILFSNNHRDKLFSKVLTAFIGWLSLSSGFETCLYNGMDAYSRAWISFAFPFYIWIILGLIVVLSRRSVLVMRFVGSNAVKVLATLILLSYSQLILLIVAGIDFTTVYDSNNTSWLVWTKDGNIPLFGREHLPLFIFTLCLSVLLVPFTVSLLFIQILERYSHFRIFCFVNKFKPLLDAYTGPYTGKARFWTGFLLVVRIFISISSPLTGRLHYMENTSIATALILLILTTGFFLREGVYKKKGVQVLEGSLLLNLALLLVATSYTGYNGRDQTTYTHGFVGIVLLTFISVIVYHVVRKIYTITRVQECFLAAKRKVVRKRLQYQRIEPQYNSTETGYLPSVVRFTEDREPLLADS